MIVLVICLEKILPYLKKDNKIELILIKPFFSSLVSHVGLELSCPYK